MVENTERDSRSDALLTSTVRKAARHGCTVREVVERFHMENDYELLALREHRGVISSAEGRACLDGKIRHRLAERLRMQQLEREYAPFRGEGRDPRITAMYRRERSEWHHQACVGSFGV